jgi:hypothetical protein
VYVAGDVQIAVAESRLQRNVVCASPLKRKRACVEGEPLGGTGGPDAIEGAAGGILSIVYVSPATGRPVRRLPAPSAIVPAFVRRSCRVPVGPVVDAPVDAVTA